MKEPAPLRPRFVTDEMLTYLNHLRETSDLDMMRAWSELFVIYPLTEVQAQQAAQYWRDLKNWEARQRTK